MICDRTCLEGFLDTYIDALIARDPSGLPVSSTYKFTENGQRLQIGDGLWNTVTGRGNYRLPVADVAAGQVAMLGTIDEADTATVFVLRLKIVEREITEIETLVIRNKEAAENLNKIGAPRPIFSSAVPERKRLSRGELARTANMYFSGIELNDGKGDYPLADSCARLENGVVTAGDPIMIYGPDHEAPSPGDRPRYGCREQFELGLFYYVTRIRDRRFTILDPERGIAFAFAFFDNAGGDYRFGTLADGREVESGPSIPWTWQIAEIWKIEDGLIGPVESVLHPVPYGMGSGWSTWEESMSSRARWSEIK